MPSGGGHAAPPTQSLLSRQASILEELHTLQRELRAVRAAQEELDHRYADDAFARPLRDEIARIGAGIGAMEERLAAAERAAEAERAAAERKLQAVVAVVTAENAQLRQAIAELGAGPKAGGEYTVRPGDTLAGIAQRHGIRVRDLREANEIADPNVLRAGQRLAIPRLAR
jgi:nucleoid-associated protein YgaU